MTEHTHKSDREATTVRSRLISPDNIYDRFIQTKEDLFYRYQNDEGQLDWATTNIRQSLLDWVSAGLIAQWVTRYKIWKDKFKDWKDFCRSGLGKDPWKVKKLIEHSQVMVELAEDGFDVLPTNQSQVDKLLVCANKLGCLISEAWEKVIDTLPEHSITANSIGEILGFPAENVNHRLPLNLAGILAREANERSLSINEMLEEDYGTATEPEPEPESPSEEKIEAWEEDLQKLIEEQDERDNQNWFLCVLLKTNSWVSQKKSQFNFLRKYRNDLQYQT